MKEKNLNYMLQHSKSVQHRAFYLTPNLSMKMKVSLYEGQAVTVDGLPAWLIKVNGRKQVFNMNEFKVSGICPN